MCASCAAIRAVPDGTYRYRPELVERLAAAKAWVNPTLYVMKAGIERLREAREREGRLTVELAAHLDLHARDQGGQSAAGAVS